MNSPIACARGLARRLMNRRAHGTSAGGTRRGPLWRALPLTLASGAALLTLAGPAVADSCPNAAVRTGPSAALPDCRAYELVSPVAKNGNPVFDLDAAASASGQSLEFESFGAFPGAPSAAETNSYLAARGADGWSSVVLSPPASEPNPSLVEGWSILRDASSDFSTYLLTDFGALDPSEPNGGLYRRQPDGSFQYVAPLIGTLGAGAYDGYVGASADLSEVLFEDPAQLVPIPGNPSTSGNQLYVSHDGQLSLVNVDDSGNLLNDDGAILGATSVTGIVQVTASQRTAVSTDGSKVFFESPDPSANSSTATQLYMRDIPNQQTIEVSASTLPAPQPESSNVTFQGAATDGSRVYFTTSTPLTADTTGPAPYLYVYDTDTDTLSFAAAGIADTGSDQESSGVVVSADGTRAFYVSASDNGLYMYSATTGSSQLLVPDVERADDLILNSNGSFQPCQQDQLTSSGNDLVFQTAADLVPGDTNTGTQVYEYDVPTGTLRLISAGPASAQPFNASIVNPEVCNGEYFDAPHLNVSDDGQYVFFETTAALVPQDTNGVSDVYEWHDGAVSLLGEGNGTGSAFVGASSDGSNAFIESEDQLSWADGDTLNDVYDARIDGGFAPPPAAANCDASASCEGTAAPPPAAPGAGSAAFTGPGDPHPATTPPPKAKVTGKVKVVKKTVSGSRLVLEVKVPARGKLSASGSDVKSVKKSVGKAGTYRLTLTLTPKARRAELRRRNLTGSKRKLKVTIHVAYSPSNGKRSTATVSVPVEAKR